MTDKEKLQQLFHAALQDPSHGTKPLARAFPTVPAVTLPVAQPGPIFEPVEHVVMEAPVPTKVESLVEPMLNAGLRRNWGLFSMGRSAARPAGVGANW